MGRVVINGREANASEGETLLEVIRRVNGSVPTLCFFSGMYREASCRLCLVELRNGRLVPACAYPVSEGLEVRTDTPRVRRVRRLIIELILAIHKIKCWSCPRKGGHCELSRLASEYWVEGIPVCSSCPLHGSDCLVVKGEPCLGPLTIAGCRSPCPTRGIPCMGCRGPITRRDVIEEAVKFYVSHGIELCDVIEATKLFWEGVPQINLLRNRLAQAFEKVKANR